jgi:hypothetical protein
MAMKHEKDLPYFRDDAEVAAYLNMDLQSFLRFRNQGRFGVVARPIDPRLRYFRDDVARFIALGRPVSDQRRTSGPQADIGTERRR